MPALRLSIKRITPSETLPYPDNRVKYHFTLVLTILPTLDPAVFANYHYSHPLNDGA
jgi:hypothetical protein